MVENWEESVDFYRGVDKSDNIEYLETLIQYIEDDIQNLEKQSVEIIQLRAQMSGLSPEEFLKKVNVSLLDKKQYIEDKLNKLKTI